MNRIELARHVSQPRERLLAVGEKLVPHCLDVDFVVHLGWLTSQGIPRDAARNRSQQIRTRRIVEGEGGAPPLGERLGDLRLGRVRSASCGRAGGLALACAAIGRESGSPTTPLPGSGSHSSIGSSRYGHDPAPSQQPRRSHRRRRRRRNSPHVARYPFGDQPESWQPALQSSTSRVGFLGRDSDAASRGSQARARVR
jgi:hypothetical protein